MGVGRRFQNKPRSRPKKSATDKKRRLKTHQKRLVALGVPAENLRTMDPVATRKLMNVLVAKAAKKR